MKTTVLLFDTSEGTGDALLQISGHLQDNESVCTVPVSISEIDDHIGSCVAQGIRQIVLLPCTTGLAPPLKKSLSETVQKAQTAFPDLRIGLAPALGEDPRLIDLLQERIHTCRAQLAGTAPVPILKVEGLVETPGALGFQDLLALPGQIPDVSRIDPKRPGGGIWVKPLLAQFSPKPEATHITFHADNGQFSATVSLGEAQKGLFIYRLQGSPLPEHFGGPLRLIIPETEDRCANVKAVSRIELTAQSP